MQLYKPISIEMCNWGRVLAVVYIHFHALGHDFILVNDILEIGVTTMVGASHLSNLPVHNTICCLF